jgi:hypothetical protein
MPLPKLMLPPAQGGYSAAPGETFKQAKLGSGASRFRLDSANAPATINIQWACSPIQYQYLMAFGRSVVSNWSLYFLCDLILDSALLQEYEVHLVGGPPSLVSVQGHLMTVRAQAEVVPQAADADADMTMIWLYAAYGEDAGTVLQRLAKLVNEDLTVLA